MTVFFCMALAGLPWPDTCVTAMVEASSPAEKRSHDISQLGFLPLLGSLYSAPCHFLAGR